MAFERAEAAATVIETLCELDAEATAASLLSLLVLMLCLGYDCYY